MEVLISDSIPIAGGKESGILDREAWSKVINGRSHKKKVFSWRKNALECPHSVIPLAPNMSL